MEEWKIDDICAIMEPNGYNFIEGKIIEVCSSGAWVKIIEDISEEKGSICYFDWKFIEPLGKNGDI